MTRFQSAIAASLVMLVIPAACSDSTKPVDPASIASISLAPSTIYVEKGSAQSLTLTAADSVGAQVPAKAAWRTSAPSVATVSGAGVVTGVGYGTATITAVVGTHTTNAAVVVTAAPVLKAYSVLDLGAALPSVIGRRLSDSGDVLASTVLYRHGTVPTALTGCGSALSVNGPGHVLCKINSYDSVSSYAIWHDGILTPLAASDTFKAQHFRAFALSDSDEVPGLFYMPSFGNAKCPANGARCLSVWKNGVASFPGYDAGGNDIMRMNNRQQVVVEYAMWSENTPTSTIYDIPTGKTRSVPYGVVPNDNGWGAIASPWIAHGSSNPFRSTALVMTPDSTVALGSGGATGINNSNVIVGTLDVGPFIWRGQSMSLLTNAATDPGWTITRASEINSSGQILATGDNSDGRAAHTVILTPTQP